MHRCTRCRWAYAPVRSLTRGHCCAGAASCANWCSGAARASSLQRSHPAWRLAVRSAQEKQMKKHCANGPALLAIGWPHLQVCQNLLTTLLLRLFVVNLHKMNQELGAGSQNPAFSMVATKCSMQALVFYWTLSTVPHMQPCRGQTLIGPMMPCKN